MTAEIARQLQARTTNSNVSGTHRLSKSGAAVLLLNYVPRCDFVVASINSAMLSLSLSNS
jgi:hypothetical protein